MPNVLMQKKLSRKSGDRTMNTELSKSAEWAREFAIDFHEDQMYGDQPYVAHLDEVAAIASPYAQDADVLSYLHDVVEDTSCTNHVVELNFGLRIADYVYYLTDCEGENRKERKRKTYEKIRSEMPQTPEYHVVKVVKAADRLSHLRKGGKNDMYAAEHTEFMSVYFVPGLCDELWYEMDFILGNMR
jgi:(p)ppGpp synthase/HD superfamily hydrolase